MTRFPPGEWQVGYRGERYSRATKKFKADPEIFQRRSWGDTTVEAQGLAPVKINYDPCTYTRIMIFFSRGSPLRFEVKNKEKNSGLYVWLNINIKPICNLLVKLFNCIFLSFLHILFSSCFKEFFLFKGVLHAPPPHNNNVYIFNIP